MSPFHLTVRASSLLSLCLATTGCFGSASDTGLSGAGAGAGAAGSGGSSGGGGNDPSGGSGGGDTCEAMSSQLDAGLTAAFEGASECESIDDCTLLYWYGSCRTRCGVPIAKERAAGVGAALDSAEERFCDVACEHTQVGCPDIDPGPPVCIAGTCGIGAYESQARLRGGGVEYGLCGGRCVTDIHLDLPTDDGFAIAELRVCDHAGADCLGNAGILTDAGEERLRLLGFVLAEADLQETYGCPGCLDGGIGKVTFETSTGVVSEHTYEHESPPVVFGDTHALIEAIRESLRACTEHEWVRPFEECVPFEP